MATFKRLHLFMILCLISLAACGQGERNESPLASPLDASSGKGGGSGSGSGSGNGGGNNNRTQTSCKGTYALSSHFAPMPALNQSFNLTAGLDATTLVLTKNDCPFAIAPRYANFQLTLTRRLTPPVNDSTDPRGTDTLIMWFFQAAFPAQAVRSTATELEYTFSLPSSADQTGCQVAINGNAVVLPAPPPAAVSDSDRAVRPAPILDNGYNLSGVLEVSYSHHVNVAGCGGIVPAPPDQDTAISDADRAPTL